MSLRILQLGRACFGAREEMCISSNRIEPAGRAGRGLKQGLPGCESRGRAGMRAGCLGVLQGVSCQPVSAGLPPSPHPSTRLTPPCRGAETLQCSLVISARFGASLCHPTRP